MEKSQALSFILEKVHQTLQKYRTCRIGLSGGKTPRPLYEQLSHQNVPWNRIQFILTDERNIKPTEEGSNFRMISEALFSKIEPNPENLLIFNTFLSREDAVNKLQSQLESLRRERQPLFDILILGMGNDGHTASLFPHTKALDSKWLVTTSETNQFDIRDRLTLTYNALLDSDEVILLIEGEEKKRTLAKAQEGTADFHEWPIAKILQNKPVKIF